MNPSTQHRIARILTLLTVAAVVAGPLVLYRDRLAQFSLSQQDLLLVSQQRAADQIPNRNFWLSRCLDPLRLVADLLIGRVNRLVEIPGQLRWSSICALPLALWMLLVVLQDKTGSVGAAVAGVAFAGITTVYFPAVATFTGTRLLWCMVFLLGVIRLAGTGGVLATAGMFVAALVAVAWSPAGLVAGPMGLAFALARRGLGRAERWVAAMAPLAGTACFLLLAMASGTEFLATGVDDPAQPPYFRADLGVYLGVRGMIEHFWFWSVAINASTSGSQAIVWGLLLAALLVAAQRAVRSKSLFWCGLALTATPWVVYGLHGADGLSFVRSARAYSVFAHFGGAMVLASVAVRIRSLCGAYPTGRGLAMIWLLMAALWAIHVHSARILCEEAYHHGQTEQLARLDLLERAAQKMKLGKSSLRQALGPFKLYGSTLDGIDLLRVAQHGGEVDLQSTRATLRQVLELGYLPE